MGLLRDITGAVETGYGLAQQIRYDMALGKDYDDAVRAQAGLQLSGAEVAQNQFNAEQAALQRSWEKNMSDTAYQRQVADMQAAGINPALAMGHAQGASTPSGAVASAAAPRQSKVESFQNAVAMRQLSLQTKALAADVSLKEEQAKNIAADTEGKEISNEKLPDFLELRNEGMQLQNSLTDDNKKKISAEIDNLRKNNEYTDSLISKVEEETKTELTRREYIETQSALNHITANNAAALLPYQQALMSAQGKAAQAQASLSFVRAAYEEGLYDDSYIFNMQKSLAAEVGLKTESWSQSKIKTQFDELKLIDWRNVNGLTEDRPGVNRLINGSKIVGSFLGNIAPYVGKTTSQTFTYTYE